MVYHNQAIIKTTLDKVIECIGNDKRKAVIDANYGGGHDVVQLNDEIRISYMKGKKQPMVSVRDSYILSRSSVIETNKSRLGHQNVVRVLLIGSESIQFEDLTPEHKPFVRIVLFFGGYYAEEFTDGKDTYVDLHNAAEVDPKLNMTLVKKLVPKSSN